MNGQFPRSPVSPGIAAALTISTLIHVAVVATPYLGQSRPERRATAAAPKVPPRLVASLLTSRRPTPNPLPAFEEMPQPAPGSPPTEAPRQPAELPREGADLLPLEAPVYLPTEQLTVRPQVIESKELDTPEIQPILASGRLILKLWINDRGEVADVGVEHTDLPQAFAEAAGKAFRQMRFSPGERDGKPVGTVMRIEIQYDDGRKPPDEARAARP